MSALGSEVGRLRHLDEEAARLGDVLARLRQSGVEPAPSLTPKITAREVREVIRARRMRDRFFSTGLFEDPAWDMLLDLYAAELEGGQVSVSSLCLAAAVAPTTALRWISKLTDAGLFVREPDPFDGRRFFINLSEKARAAMLQHLDALRDVGLRLA